MLYKIIDNLLYFDNNKKGLRLYILFAIEVEVFKLAYNKIRYSRYTYIYKKLTEGLYIFNIIINLYKFIRYYSYC